MTRKKWTVLALVLATVLALGIAVPALAQEPAEEEPTPRLGGVFGRFPLFNGTWGAFDSVAEALGLDPVDFFERLHDGQTIEEIADDLGVDLEQVQEMLKDQRTQAMRDRIDSAVEDGEMDEGRAEWLLEGLDNGYLTGRGGMAGRTGRSCPPARGMQKAQ